MPPKLNAGKVHMPRQNYLQYGTSTQALMQDGGKGSPLANLCVHPDYAALSAHARILPAVTGAGQQCAACLCHPLHAASQQACLLDMQADATTTVALPKEGPVHDFQWSPNGDFFVTVAGFMPAKVCLLASRLHKSVCLLHACKGLCLLAWAYQLRVMTWVSDQSSSVCCGMLDACLCPPLQGLLGPAQHPHALLMLSSAASGHLHHVVKVLWHA